MKFSRIFPQKSLFYVLFSASLWGPLQGPVLGGPCEGGATASSPCGALSERGSGERQGLRLAGWAGWLASIDFGLDFGLDLIWIWAGFGLISASGLIWLDLDFDLDFDLILI